MNGVITIALNEEKYYHWTEILFKSILLYTDIEFCLVYDNTEWFTKYNLDKIVKYPIHKSDIQNPYLFKYELIEYTPFDNTIFLDSDTIIFKDITPLFSEQFLCICADYSNGYVYNLFSFIPNPSSIIKKLGLKKLYSAYSGYLRFEKTNFYKKLFRTILDNVHYDKNIHTLYNRNVMPDEYFLNISISDLVLEKFIPIQLFHIDEIQTNMYGYSYQGESTIENKIVLNYIKNTLESLNMVLKINNTNIQYKSNLI